MTTMKIAIPSMGETLDSFLSNNLGRTPFIIIYDGESNSFQSFANPGYKIQDGSGLKAAEVVIQNKEDVLFTMEIGRKAYSVLMNKHIDVHLLNVNSKIKDVINKFLKE